MDCVDCLQNCGGVVTSDQCVTYTGDNIPILGICTGNQLSIIESKVLNALLTTLDGTGISPANVTVANCPYLAAQFVGKNPTLANFLQLLIDNECSLKAMIDSLTATVAGGNATFNTGCLSGLPANATANQVLQALLLDYCTTKATVAAIPSIYLKQSDLAAQVTNILTILGLIGGSVTQQFSSYLPAGIAFPYFGSLANFDNTGKGLVANGFDGFYLCNGLNGTVDLRGRSIVGAVRNVPGGTLDTAVDPTQTFNPSTNYALGDKFGINNVTLTTSQIPSHTHGVNDPGHAHNIFGQTGGDNNDNNNTQRFAGGDKSPTESSFFFTNTVACQLASTGVTIGAAGGGNFHNNVQPSAAAYWVIRL